MAELTTQQSRVCKALGLTQLPQTQIELDAALATLEKLQLDSLTETAMINLKVCAPPLPKPPQMTSSKRMSTRLQRLQHFIEEFQYNHTGIRFINLKKTEGMYRVSRTAKQIIQDGLPIKCIEAVFLGAYLTLGIKSLLRIPIAFKSCAGGSNTFQHIVMAVAHGTSDSRKWGAIGLSRATTLMYKTLRYASLSELLLEYKTAYENEHHELVNIYVGLPFGRDEFSQLPIQWRVLRLHVSALAWSKLHPQLKTKTSAVSTPEKLTG